MKRFRFRLESVLTLRDLAERRARELFGLAHQKAAAAAEVAAAAAERRARLAIDLAGLRSGSFRPSEQSSGLAALRLAERAETEARRVADEAAAARERSREEWLAARRRLQVIQKLEDRARVAHRESADKAEQALLDELASLGAGRAAPLA